jgi:DNA-binding LacI/PurR family transcriptional regulator
MISLYRDTPERRALRQAMLNARDLANLAGLPIATVRNALHGKRRPRPSTRAKLAAALRAHSATLATLADTLER